MVIRKKKLFPILSIFVGINCCFHIYSNDISLYIDGKSFCDWFNDKVKNKQLSPILQNNDKLIDIVNPDKNENIKMKKIDDISGTQYYFYNKLNIAKVKEILGINEGEFIVLLYKIKILKNEEDITYHSTSLAIWFKNSNYEIIDINFGSHAGRHEILDKDKFYVCRDKYFSVYKIDLTDLDLKYDTLSKKELHSSVTTPVKTPKVKSVVSQVVKPKVKPVKNTSVTTSVVKSGVKSVVPQVVKSVKNTSVITPVVKSGVKSVKNTSVTTPVVKSGVNSVMNTSVPPIGLKGKDTDLSDSTAGNITGNSNIMTTCSCRRNN